MKSREADKIRVRFYELQPSYEKLAAELRRVLDHDTRFPNGAVYGVKHRLKDHGRLIEKIDSENETPKGKKRPITSKDFEERIHDLLGLRIVVLRLSDLDKVREYLDALFDERKLKIVKGPIEKTTFILKPGTDRPSGRDVDLQYSGYSSIHYVIRLGSALRPQPEIAALKAELQLRTIFEEAWGEIDHKYRYELKRSGKPIPQHVEDGFRDLALYLQSVARQADHVCEHATQMSAPAAKKDRRGSSAIRKTSPAGGTLPATPAGKVVAPPAPQSLALILKQKLGFEPTPRTVSYIHRRLDEHSWHTGRQWGLSELERAIDQSLLDRFKAIYTQELNREPFRSQSSDELDRDVVPLINFALFGAVQSTKLAEAGLRATLSTRLDYSA